MKTAFDGEVCVSLLVFELILQLLRLHLHVIVFCCCRACKEAGCFISKLCYECSFANSYQSGFVKRTSVSKNSERPT